ncbi:NUDIX domain-containing protein [Streptomyces sp. CBMA29]|uniref:NUDIX domain-containing protein n=1 Tax=Streptomyces sp. CBMA29 TaxID=1896314 RepID=UPI00166213F5|nr:NUDIX hydrolase [Streptomyces sp. CBMA29]MBD0739810.1 hypothetical protein [Streptomyces sp. CBMA29]
MHADTDTKMPPRRRHGCVVLITDDDHRILLVKPTYKHQDEERGWQLPGGHAHANEPIAEAGERELLEETGLSRTLTHVLLVDQVPANPETGSAEGVNFVLEGGYLTSDEANRVTLPPSAAHELSALKWVDLGELDAHTFPYQARRIRAAAAHRAFLSMPLYESGVPLAPGPGSE